MVLIEEGQQLCEQCNKFITIEKLLTPGCSRNWVFSDAAELSDSCALCSMILWVSKTRQDFIKTLPRQYSARIRPSDKALPRQSILAMIISSYNSWTELEFRMLTNKGDVLQEVYGLPYIRIVGPSTSSELSFGAARKWLRECLDCHHPDYGPPAHQAQSFRPMFCGSTQSTGLGPSRVLECLPDASAGDEDILSSDKEFAPSCKLVNSAETDGRYAALSYSWGTLDYKSFVTTTNNVAVRREVIDETELPQVFQDAIRVARNLRIRYLWIDAFCILQDWWKPPEDQTDWIEESTKMADIFSHALVTIFAASVESERGLFNGNSNTSFDNPNIFFNEGRTSCASTSARFIHSNGKSSVLHFIGHERWHWGRRKSLQESCLERRVWCYQEDLLSSRKLYYCRDQLYWCCDHLAASEDRLLEPTRTPYRNDYLNAVGLSLDPHVPSHAIQMCSYWYVYLIGTRYRARGTTHERDRLIAVSGLAKRVGAATKSRYLAGLWQSSVIEGLLWAASPSETSCDTKTADAPTWSWASQRGNFIYHPRSVMIPLCKFIRADIDYFNSRDLFGAVNYAALTLQGRLLSAAPKNGFYELPVLGVALHRPAWDCNGFDPAKVCIMALPLIFGWGELHLLLVTTSASDSSRYIRVGVADVRLSGVVDALDFDGLVRSVPETEITLI